MKKISFRVFFCIFYTLHCLKWNICLLELFHYTLSLSPWDLLPRGFFHSDICKRHDLCGDHETHNALLFPGREKLIPNLLSLKTVPPTRTATGFTSVRLLWTLSLVLLRSRWAPEQWKLGKVGCDGQKGTRHKAQTHRRLLQKMAFLERKQLETNQQQCSADASKLDLTLLTLLWSSNGQRGFSYFLQ